MPRIATATCSGLTAVVVALASMWLVPPRVVAAQMPGPSLLASGTMDLRWTAPLELAPGTTPDFDEQAAFVVARDGTLARVDLERGVVDWQVAAATALSPSVGGGLVYVAGADGVEGHDATDGALVWRRALPGPAARRPYWDTGWLIVSLESGDLVALRASDGAPVWQVALGAAVQVPPAPSLDNLYLGLSDGRTVALALATGRPVWTRTFDGQATGLTALDDQLLVGTTGGALYSLDLLSGRPRWRLRLGAAVSGAPAADDRRIYVVAFDHVLRALSRGSGSLQWRQGLPHRPAGGPVLLGGAVLVPTYANELAGYATATGEPSVSLSSASEVIGATQVRVGGRVTGTRLTAVTTEGRLVGFAPRIEPAPAPLADLPGTPVPEPPPPSTGPPQPPPADRDAR
ncbi:MAG: PQQ-binding-like beta-propeller repeat protein [Vicinamibacterales bacterium]